MLKSTGPGSLPPCSVAQLRLFLHLPQPLLPVLKSEANNHKTYLIGLRREVDAVKHSVYLAQSLAYRKCSIKIKEQKWSCLEPHFSHKWAPGLMAADLYNQGLESEMEHTQRRRLVRREGDLRVSRQVTQRGGGEPADQTNRLSWGIWERITEGPSCTAKGSGNKISTGRSENLIGSSALPTLDNSHNSCRYKSA